MKHRHRFVSLALAASLLLGLAPAQAQAADYINSASYHIERHDFSLSENGVLQLQHYYDNVVLDDDTPQAQSINRLIQQDCDEYCAAAQESVDFAQQNPPYYEGDYYRDYVEPTVTQNDDGILSIKMTNYWYMGGVANTLVAGLNFDLNTGEKLDLASLFSLSESATETYLKNQSINYINTHPDGYWWDDAKATIMAYTLDDFNYYIEDNSVVLVYEQYELAPGAMGVIEIACPIVNDQVTVLMNGDPLRFDQPPIIDNGRVMVPIRAIFEALGYSVTWDQATQTGTASNGTNTIRVTVSDPAITYSGGTYHCDVPPKNIAGRILVPIRAISESAGCTVDWHSTTKTVTIAD